jgi:galactokinase
MTTAAAVDALPVPDPAAQAARAADRFTAAFGHAPDGVWWAPGRVNLIGEHVDYHEGLVLPVALQVGTAVAVGVRTDGTLRLGSGQEPQAHESALADVGPGRVPGWAGYVAGVPWALAAAGHDVPGFDAWVEGAVPPGAGLSSSAALECAVAVALAQLAGLPGADAADDAGRRALAQACIRAENEIAGASTGGMDQSVSLRARAGHAFALDCRDWAAEHLPLDGPLAADGLTLLVVDTRAHHTHAGGEYGDRRTLSMAAARRLGVDVLRDVPVDGLDEALARLDDEGERAAVRHIVTEIERVRLVAAHLRAGTAAPAGPLFTESHTSMRDDYRISCPELDAVVEAALAAGATGARMTGGGFGGSAVVLAEQAGADAVVTAVARRFADESWAPPGVLRVDSGGGPATRLL